MNRVFVRACAVLLLLGATFEAVADPQDFSGTVSRIFDGDSFLVRNASGKDVDVRLIDIDAPEKDQPYGDRARAALIELIASRRVFVDVIDTDKYQRKLARVYREPDRLDVARAMVHDGNVWLYRRTLRDASLIPLEDAARQQHLGLWSLPKSDLMPPWTFRYLKRQEEQGSGHKERRKDKPATLASH
ncbi:MAG TPA: thermonuclease family protein [Steroidobacteraceae bacterium]|nr:thermonuclease family protein [Steroidobacteraceae bacterium]